MATPFDSLKQFLKDVGDSVARQFKLGVVDLAKIEAAVLYLKGVRMLRDHFLAMVALLFSLLVLAVSIVVAPIALVWSLPLDRTDRLWLIGLLAVLDFCVPLAVLNRFLSQKAWIKFSKSDELLDKLLDR